MGGCVWVSVGGWMCMGCVWVGGWVCMGECGWGGCVWVSVGGVGVYG